MDRDPMFSSRTDSELMRMYHVMTERAKQLHVDLSSYTSNQPHVHNHRDGLINRCERLHARLAAFEAGLDEQDAPRASPGLRRLRAHPDAEKIRQQTLADNERARARINEERVMSETTTGNGAAPAADPKPARKKRAAKAAGAKGAKGAKKAAAKKGAKKAVAKKGGAKKAASPRAAADAEKKITVLTKENPRRKGTQQHDMYEVIKKHGGRTVATFLAAGGARNALNLAVEQKHAKVS